MFGVSFFGSPGRAELITYTEAGTYKFLPKKAATGYYVEAIGGGGGGLGGGGGGGGFNYGFILASELLDETEIVVGAGGAGAASPSSRATDGGDSYFGTFVRARGGEGGYSNSSIALSGDYVGKAVSPNNQSSESSWSSGSGAGGTGDAPGGSCIKGGAGGGRPSGSADGSGGVSLDGGNGGDGSHTGNGQDGSAPGGGGGGSHPGTGGNGGAGRVKVWVFY